MNKGIACTGCPLEGHGKEICTISLPSQFDGIRLLVQGDNPTQDDLDAGKPFSGKVGHWLKHNWLGNAGLRESEVLFDNTIRCRSKVPKQPYPVDKKKDKTRTAAETHCRPYSVWDSTPTRLPLLAVGSEAAADTIGVGNIADWNGHIDRRVDGRVVGVTYHPASVMKNPNLLPLVVKHTANVIEASQNPSVLDRPEIVKGFTPYRKEDAVVDLEWEYDYKTKQSGATTIVGLAYSGDVGHSSPYVESGLSVVRRHLDEGNRVIGHNIIGADLPRLGALPLSFGPDHIFDTQIVAHLLHAHWAELGLFGLGDLVKFYFPTTDWKKDKGDALSYNGRDVAYNYRLAKAMMVDLDLTDQWHLVEKQQLLARMTSLMKQKGLRIDSEAIKTFNANWKTGRDIAKSGLPFNPNSPKQVIEWFRDRGIKLPNTTLTTLKKYAGKFPEIDAVLDFKGAGKGLKSWYDEEAVERGYIYPSHNVTGTAVARFSSSGPNVQNIPPWAKFAILPHSDDEYIYNADAKNLEGRTVAFEAGDEQMLADFASGTDIHSVVASRVFGVPLSSIDKKGAERQVGKTVVHASNYGEGAYNLARRLYGNASRESVKKAETIQKAYFKAYRKTGDWHKSVAAQLDRGDIMLRNAHGRVRFIYAQDSHERVKRGTHFLGCSDGADLVNQKALDIWKELKLLPMMIVHDSLTYSLPKGDAGLKLEARIKEIQDEPMACFQGKVEFPWEASRGPNYKEQTTI